MKRFIDVNELKKRAEGRWEMILSALAPELNHALSRVGKHVPCPIHGGKDGFRFFDDDVFIGAGICNTCGSFYHAMSLLCQLKGWDFRTLLQEIDALLPDLSKFDDNVLREKSTFNHVAIAQTLDLKNSNKEKLKQQKINELWSQSISLSSPSAHIAQNYLKNRGIEIKDLSILDNSLRFHQGIPYFEENGVFYQNLPCLLGAICNESDRVTLLRTYLNRSAKKANVSTPKKMLPFSRCLTLKNSAIKLISLSNQQDILCVAEGIETALSVYSALELPIWSCANAHQLASFQPPYTVKKLLIWADLDQSGTGIHVASKLKSRMEALGIESIILLPPYQLLPHQKGIDWNDVLNQKGPDFIRHFLRLMD